GPFTHVAAGFFHVCAIDGAGELECWGDNSTRAFSPMAQDTFVSPAVIATGPFVDVHTGQYTSCVRGAGQGAAIACLGDNAYGQLGIGSMMAQSALQPLCFGN